MSVEVLKKMKKLCLCCMEEHEIMLVRVDEKNMFKDEEIEYQAIYEYCEETDEYFEPEELISQNDISLKNAYRVKVGFLTSNDIVSIRRKYDISQSDLSLLLGWGEKTIARYEGHQVQDAAHDSILRKIESDPEWFLELLETNKYRLKKDAYDRYYGTAVQLYENNKDSYLRKAVKAEYARLNKSPQIIGNSSLNLDKLVEVVVHFSSSKKMKYLYKVKLMKLLWYADALSYKRYGHSMMGLAYTKLPMGAVPVAYRNIIELNGITYDEREFDNGSVGCFFYSPICLDYQYLDDSDLDILNYLIEKFGSFSKDDIVEYMHKESAYEKTSDRSFISYEYANELSLD